MVTMRQVAEKAGVSRPTVSYVLNGQESGQSISQATKTRVLKAAEELGYRKNTLARAMATGKYNVIGLLRHHADEQFSFLLDGVLREADSQGYTVKVITRENLFLDRELIQRCAELRLAGLIGVQVAHDGLAEIQAELERLAIPMVVLDQAEPNPYFSRVASKSVEAIEMMVDHLVGLGHQRLQFLGGAAPDRRQGFEQAMQRHGLPVPSELPWCNYIDVPLIEQLTRQLLRDEAQRPTAIVCISDPMAMVVCRTARAEGFSVPADLSVTGYDDLAMAACADPPLTTVAQPFHEMGRSAVQRLLLAITAGGYMLEGNDQLTTGIQTPTERSTQPYLLPTRLVVRASTGPAPQRAGKVRQIRATASLFN